MNTPLRPEVEAAFAAALELSRAEQEIFLAREFGRYPEVRAEVESLLRAYRAAGNFLEQGTSECTAGGTTLVTAASSALPPTIGRYRILRLLGEGGMGIVYEAEQEQPRRAVALKVIKAEFAHPELLRRFDQECRALGRLQHPGIAQIYEAGMADNGLGPRPYFAMELVHGASLIEYVHANQLTTRGRLELMSKVCDAVYHAHQRGVIHRDLKPANILVDESGQPKILDFGIARAADRESSSQDTGLGQLVGTLAYMSPEQVLAGSKEIDARSDVYALGVVLFQLLVGRLPYQLSNQLQEAVQTIREEDPTPLSAISRGYRGDVETIVAKALEKDKHRRYSSAAELGADIRRYLQNQPIVARRQSAAYQLQKFARRHSGLVAGVAAVFVVLIVGIIASAWEAAAARHAEQHALHERDRAAAAERVATEERNRALRAEHVATTERNRAIAAETQAVRDRNRAVAEKHRADSESAIAKTVNSFLQNDLLAQASASGQARRDAKPDPDLKVRTALDRAAARITGHFENQPMLEAAIRQTIGNTYKELGLFLEAQRQLERAVDLRVRSLREEHADTLTAMNALAEIYDDQGKYAQAEPLYTKVLEVRRRVLGEKHPDTLFSMNGLALLYRHEGKYEQAETLYAKSLEGERRVLGEEHPDTLVTMNNLAVLYQIRNKLALAEPLLTKVLEVRRRVLGEEHPSTLVSLNTLALLYLNQGKYARAEPLFSKTLEIRRTVLGEQHPNTLNSMNNLARLYLNQGRYAPAELLFVRVMELRERAQGNEHPESLLSINNLAVLYRAEGKYAQSEMLLRRALGIQQHVLGDEHPDTLLSMYNLGRLYQVEGKYLEAEQLFIKLVEIRRRRVVGPDHPDTTNVLVSLGEIRLQQKRYAEAEQLLRDALNGQEKRSPDAWQRCNSQSVLGYSLTVQAKFVEAEPLSLSGYKGLMQRRAMIPAESQSAVELAGDRIVRLYLAWGKPEKVAEWQQRLQLATRDDHVP